MKIKIPSTLQPIDESFRLVIRSNIEELVGSTIQIVETNLDDINGVIITTQDGFGPIDSSIAD